MSFEPCLFVHVPPTVFGSGLVDANSDQLNNKLLHAVATLCLTRYVSQRKFAFGKFQACGQIAEIVYDNPVLVDVLCCFSP